MLKHVQVTTLSRSFNPLNHGKLDSCSSDSSECSSSSPSRSSSGSTSPDHGISSRSSSVTSLTDSTSQDSCDSPCRHVTVRQNSNMRRCERMLRCLSLDESTSLRDAEQTDNNNQTVNLQYSAGVSSYNHTIKFHQKVNP